MWSGIRGHVAGNGGRLARMGWEGVRLAAAKEIRDSWQGHRREAPPLGQGGREARQTSPVPEPSVSTLNRVALLGLGSRPFPHSSPV